RPRLEAMLLHGIFGGDQHAARRVRDLAADGGGEAAALDEGLQRGHLLERGAAARTLVDADLLAGDVDVRDDLALEAALVDRGQCALVAGERELLHVFTGDVPL